jgi:predicted enzyme related to lactoylglutathione lyase
MKNIFHWVEIRTRDLDKAKKFYGSLFNWKSPARKTKIFPIG